MGLKVEKGEEDDYNPFEHRKVEQPNSDVRSLANLVKSSLGSGLLAMPLAFSNAGWGLGIVGTIIITFICAHCVHIFVKTSHSCCRIVKEPLLGYAGTCKAAFANGPKRLRPFANAACKSTRTSSLIGNIDTGKIGRKDPSRRHCLESGAGILVATALRSLVWRGSMLELAASVNIYRLEAKHSNSIHAKFFSMDMQKVILLPDIPQIKESPFTKMCAAAYLYVLQKSANLSFILTLGTMVQLVIIYEECQNMFNNSTDCTTDFGDHRVGWLNHYCKNHRVFAEFSLFFTYIGVACIFTVLIADSVKQILDEYYPVMILPVEYYCLILLIPLILLVQIRHLKWLAPLSVLANSLLIITFVICLYYIFGDEPTFSDRKVVGSWTRFPAFLSTVIFAIEGIGIVMPVENAMKYPGHFIGCPSVLVIAMSIIAVLYTTLGLFGYWRYGDVLRGSITLNLPIDDWPAICAKVFIALTIFFTYPLHFFVVTDIFTRYTEPHVKEKYRNYVQIFGRSFLVCICGGIGIALPMLEQIINLVGAFFYSILGLIIPGVVETVFRWNDLGKFNWILWKNFLIVLFGFCAMVSGCSVTIFEIIDKLNSVTV